MQSLGLCVWFSFVSSVFAHDQTPITHHTDRGAYSRLFCYDQAPFGPAARDHTFNVTEQTLSPRNVVTEETVVVVPANTTHAAVTELQNVTRVVNTTITTTTTHAFTGLKATPRLDSIALEYSSFNPFLAATDPPLTEPNTVAWLKAFLFYPAPTLGQTTPGGKRLDYADPDYFDSAPIQASTAMYGSDGFVMELPATLTPREFRWRLEELRAHDWVDARTRAVVALANFYNVHTGHFLVVQCIAELDETGQFHSRFHATPIVADVYDTSYGKLAGLLAVLVFFGAIRIVYMQSLYWRAARDALRDAVAHAHVGTPMGGGALADNMNQAITWEAMNNMSEFAQKRCAVTRMWLSSIWTLIELGVVVPCLVARGMELAIIFNQRRNFSVSRPPC
jgi:hypothetical protein